MLTGGMHEQCLLTDLVALLQQVGRQGRRRDPAASGASTAPARTSDQTGGGALQVGHEG
jgi:hypothetical protein